MNSRILVVLLLGLSISATGCSRFRGLRRNEYALMKDPFAEPATSQTANGAPSNLNADESAIAQVSAADEADGSTARANYDQVEDDAAFQPQPAQPGQSIRTAAANSDALNPFVGADASATENAAADMAAFVQQQAAAADESAHKAVQEIDAGFSDFAEQKKQQWAEQVNAANQSATAAAAGTASVDVDEAAAIFDGLAGIDSSADDSVADNAVATPLIDRSAQFSKSVDPPIGRASPFDKSSTESTPSQPPRFGNTPKIAGPLGPQGAVSEPIFDAPASETAAAAVVTEQNSINPFAAFETDTSDDAAPSAAAPGSSGSSPTPEAKSTLDAGFSFDSGWRPQDVEQ